MVTLHYKCFYIDYVVYDEFNIDYFHVMQFTIGKN